MTELGLDVRMTERRLYVEMGKFATRLVAGCAPFRVFDGNLSSSAEQGLNDIEVPPFAG